MQIPENIKTINRVLTQAGFQCYVVGGAVRNYVAGLKPKDYDLTTNAHPDDVISLFRRTVPTGLEHGTVTILMGKEQYEITTFRTESTYSDSRHPDKIEFAESIEEDLSRRDFTMNALAWDVSHKKIIDLHGGTEAIKKKIIKAIGSADERFKEDALRILRAVRFVSQLGFSVEQETLKAAVQASEGIQNVSMERIRDELIKTIQGAYCSDAFLLLHKAGILGLILPELEECSNIDQKGMHSFDVLTHSIYSCEGAPGENLIVRTAALLHDIGKNPCRKIDDEGNISFHHHENIGADMAEKILKRMKFPGAAVKEIRHLIRQHMFHYTDEWSDAAVRRFIARVGVENINNLFLLRGADSYGMQRTRTAPDTYNRFKRRIHEQIEQNHAISLKDLSVNGNELAEAGIPKSPVMGVILSELLDTVLDDPSLNRRENLIEIALNLYKEIRSSKS